MTTARARLKDIAAATGYSVNTVSLALHRSKRISKDTTSVILAAAEKLQYFPNQIARSLVSRSTHTIGVILTDIMNPILTLVARKIERNLGEHGYAMMLAGSDNVVASEAKAIEVLRSHQVDGILLFPANRHELEHVRPLRGAGYPVVLLGPDRNMGLEVVTVDDRLGAFKAVDHLLRLGHKRIGLIDGTGPYGNIEKFEGYAQAMAQNGIEVDRDIIVDPKGHGAASGFQATAQLMSVPNPPTAIYTVADNLAIGALAWTRINGVAVPDDLAVVGHDNIEAAEYAAVPLTTINYAADRVSDLAVDRLLALIADGQQPSQVTMVAPELVIRESCGARAMSRSP